MDTYKLIEENRLLEARCARLRYILKDLGAINSETLNDYLNKGLLTCNDVRFLFKPETIAITNRGSGIDIHKLIDESIEKKDRYVSIYSDGNGLSISIYPLDDENEED